MSKSSPGFEMIDLQNIIDSEFEVIKKSNDCSRSTDSLFNRVDVLSVQQCKLRSFLESLDARLKQAKEMQNENGRILPSDKVCSMSGDSTPVTTTEMLSVDHQFVRSGSSIDGPVSQAAHPQSIRTRSESLERKSIGGGRNSPIVIDDEEDISRSSMAGLTRLSEQAIPVPATTHSTLLPKQQEALLTNVRRRSLIIEKTPENQAYVNKNFALAAMARSTWSAETSSSLRSLKTTIRRLSGNETSLSPTGVTLPVRTRESSSVPIPTPSNTEATGSSTESASSSLNERSQSPTTEVGDVISWQQTAEYRDENASPLSTGSTPVSTGRILRNTESRSSTKISRTVSPRPHSPADFKVGSRVFGKRSSDIWFPGEITKTMPDKNKQTKYSIKYDKGQKGVLSLNHICPETHAVVEELSVGSRVVGLYGRLDIWYAGIVAEVPCGDNRNRFLIFFDDGFAQYLSVKKLHKVHHKGKNVWEDVAEHSRDFIQEYLEDYPSRPMLHVRVGQWIRTEWKGEWLKAKVLSVDGSLVKMLFQIDNRSEWIYRGSTRLDPLYRALVLGEKKTTSAKARSRKLTRNTSKGNTPYIEYNITKAAFGISPYSKTDPKGVQQLQLEEQRKITQLQQQPREVAKSAKVNVAPFRGKQPNKTTDVVNKAVKLTENKILPELEENWKTKSPANNSQGKPSVPLTPVIESTYSCIQASTMRKKTGASLANSVIFNAVDVKVQEPAPVTSSANLTSADIQLVHAEKSNEKTVEEKKLRGGKWKAPWLNLDERSKLRHSTDNVIKPETIVNTQKPRDVAAILKNKFDASAVNVKDDPASVRKPSSALNLETVRTITGPHTCSTACSRHRRGFVVNPLRHNPLAVPLLLDWKREIVKRRGKTNKRDVYYRSPCHRRLRNLGEVFQYLRLTKEKTLEIDQFTFDWRVRTKDMGQSAPIVDDISSGLEDRPIAAVNDVNNERPPDVKYVRERQLAPGVELSADPGFMVCCDCNDDCSDSTKCACIQLTIQGSKAVDGKDGDKATYQYKRLKDCIQTGIYECNPQCSCSKRCLNRVVQNGIQVRIEVFKTENRGWGLRAVDDIPAGTFICTYAGHLLNEDLANQDGRDYGDEYMAELDYIEVAEKAKEGYESGVSDLEEDDNVINEMLQFDENLSDSDNSGRSSHNEESVDVDVDDSDDSDDEDEDEEEENDDVPSSSGENCSLSSGDENSLSQRRKTLRSSKRKKVFKSQQKKKRGTLSEESLVVERESKASVLSHLADSLMCTLALKRNGNDLKKSTRFLQKLLTGEEDMAAEAIEISEKHKPVNGMTRQLSENTDVNDSRPTMLSSSDFDLDELSDDALLALHGNRDRLSSANNELTRSEEERDRTGEEQYIVGVEPVGNENGKADAEVFSSEKACKIVSTKINGEDSSLTKELEKEEDLDANRTVEEGIKVPKDDVPELLSADDLKRLAASEPKSMEPPVLLKAGEARRGSGLDEMIEKLKKRVVASDSGLSNSEIVPEKILVSEEMNERKDAGLAAENSTTSRLPYSKETSEDSGIVGGLNNSEKSCSVKEKEQDMDDDKRSLRSDSSFVSRNSSSVTQSVSSRCSSPSTDSIVKTGYKKRKDDRKSSLKGDKLLATNNSVSGKAVKTRLLFGEEHCYVIDAKTFGNCGRFLNHSCSPNLFVQNVFVDTHDLRFPRVAFFAQHNIKGGTELSWDYMYEVGSVQNKFLYCLCGSSECRGRLL